MGQVYILLLSEVCTSNQHHKLLSILSHNNDFYIIFLAVINKNLEFFLLEQDEST